MRKMYVTQENCMDFSLSSLWTLYKKKWKIFNYRFFFISLRYTTTKNDDLKRRKIYGAKDEQDPQAEPRKRSTHQ